MIAEINKYERGTYYLGEDNNLYFLSDLGTLYLLDNIQNISFEPRSTELSGQGVYDIFHNITGTYIGWLEEDYSEELGSIWGAVKGFFKKIGKGFKVAGKGIVKGFKAVGKGIWKGLKAAREALRPTEIVQEEVPVKAPFPTIPLLIGASLLGIGILLYLSKK